MKSMHNYTRQAAFSRLRSLLKQFINQHSDTFQALTRIGSPFGGNWLTAPYHADSVSTMHDQLSGLVQQLDTISEQVNRLSDQIDSTQPSGQEDTIELRRAQSAATQIGINRFRALKSTSSPA